MANCKECGKPLKEGSRHETCYTCHQKQLGGQNTSSGHNVHDSHGQGNAARDQVRPYSEYISSLSQGYFDTNGYLRAELITTWPKELARTFEKIKLTTGQMRRFYAHVRRVAQRMDYGEPFEAVRPAILEMSPLVADAVGRARSNNKNYDLFRDFIDQNVAMASEGQKQFEKGFLPHFQYVVAYFNPKDATRG